MRPTVARIALVAILALVVVTEAQQPQVVSAADRLARYFPATTIVYAEAPTLRTLLANLVPRPAEPAPQQRYDAAEIDAFYDDWTDALGAVLQVDGPTIRGLLRRTDRAAVGLLDGGMDFAELLVAFTREPNAALGAAFADAAKRLHAVQAWESGGRTGYTITPPEDLPPRLREALGMVDLRPRGEPVSVLLLDDTAFMCNSQERLAELAASWKRDGFSSFATTPAFTSLPEAARQDAGWFAVNGERMRAFAKQLISPRDQDEFDAASSLLELDRVSSIWGRLNATDLGGRFEAQVALKAPAEGERAFWPLPGASPSMLGELPDDVIAAFAVAIGPTPGKLWDRIVEHIRAAMPKDAVKDFDEGLGEFENEAGGAVESLVKPLGTHFAVGVAMPIDPKRGRRREQVTILVPLKDVAAAKQVWEKIKAGKLSREWRLDKAVKGSVAGVEAFLGTARRGLSWAFDRETLVLATHPDALRRQLRCWHPDAPPTPEDTGRALGKLANTPRFARTIGKLPRTVTAVGFADFSRIIEQQAPGEVTNEPVLSALIRDVAGGAAIAFTPGGGTLTLTLSLRDLFAGLRRAIVEARVHEYVRRCRRNLGRLGEAIRDYRIDHDTYPSALADLERAGLFRLAEYGVSPLELAQARRAGMSKEARAKIRSYVYVKPRAPKRIKPDADVPWQAPVHAFLLAYTRSAVYREGRHVLMSDGSVHWVSEAHFVHLRKLALAGRTQDDEDAEWDRTHPAKADPNPGRGGDTPEEQWDGGAYGHKHVPGNGR